MVLLLSGLCPWGKQWGNVRWMMAQIPIPSSSSSREACHWKNVMFFSIKYFLSRISIHITKSPQKIWNGSDPPIYRPMSTDNQFFVVVGIFMKIKTRVHCQHRTHGREGQVAWVLELLESSILESWLHEAKLQILNSDSSPLVCDGCVDCQRWGVTEMLERKTTLEGSGADGPLSFSFSEGVKCGPLCPQTTTDVHGILLYFIIFCPLIHKLKVK